MLNKGNITMTTRSLILTATLALAGIASAKSYSITLSAPTRAGSVKLAAGEYSMKIQDSNAIFTNLQNGKTFTIAVKTETADKKFDVTSLVTDTKDGDSYITSVQLGGSRTKIELGD
jgi:hypothetical protein